MKGISVVICCYNSSDRLPQTIRHLALQTIRPDIPWEVIIVNNNSTDDTKEAAARELARYDWKQGRHKMVDECNPGLSHARERGVGEAAYDYVLFCDDDNWLDTDYIHTAYDFLEQHPVYAAIGGCSQAAFEDGVIAPDWFEEYQMGYAVGRQGEVGDITARGYLWGAGIMFRKAVYRIVVNATFPSLLTDRKGNELSSGGDSELCLRFVIIGYKLYYSDKLKFRHFISANRLTTAYREKLWAGFLESEHILNKYYYYLKAVGRSDRNVQKLKITMKYGLHKLGIRRLTEIDERLVYVLTSLKAINYDRDYQLIRDLKKIKGFSFNEPAAGS
ncbi:MAG TPA: glycosyltransferase [Puia sp.]|nr:glycosyltransferase [Puia sp.]